MACIPLRWQRLIGIGRQLLEQSRNGAHHEDTVGTGWDEVELVFTWTKRSPCDTWARAVCRATVFKAAVERALLARMQDLRELEEGDALEDADVRLAAQGEVLRGVHMHNLAISFCSALVGCARVYALLPCRNRAQLAADATSIAIDPLTIKACGALIARWGGPNAPSDGRLTVRDANWILEMKRIYLPHELDRLRTDLSAAMLADAHEPVWRNLCALLESWRPGGLLYTLADATMNAVALRAWTCLGSACVLWVAVRGAYELLRKTLALRRALRELSSHSSTPHMQAFLEEVVFEECAPTDEEVACAGVLWQPECPWCLGVITATNARFLSCCVLSDCGPFHIVCSACVDVALDFGPRGTSQCLICRTKGGVRALTVTGLQEALRAASGRTLCTPGAPSRHDVVANALGHVLPASVASMLRAGALTTGALKPCVQAPEDCFA